MEGCLDWFALKPSLSDVLREFRSAGSTGIQMMRDAQPSGRFDRPGA